MQFKVFQKSSECAARVGEITTAHGRIKTPVFMPVGTLGSVKALSPDDLSGMGVQIILANTYHLYLRPGTEVIEKFKGLQRFMDWNAPILTDSGGFQVYSLAKLRTVSEEGVTFQSHLDGSKHFIGPERAINIQKALGSDIMMAFDECVSYPADYDYVERSVAMTSRWARRCAEVAADRQKKALFGIVQGGMYPDLRETSARELVQIGFDGYALGGLSVGEDRSTRQQVIADTVPLLPKSSPVYLMGVGKPEDILEAVMLGVDMFDCVLPTRNARNGTLFTPAGRIVIKNAQYRDDERPVEEGCPCYTCSHFSRAYLRHLFLAKELLAYRLNSIHNISYYMRLMNGIHQAITDDRLNEFRHQFYSRKRESIKRIGKGGFK